MCASNSHWPGWVRRRTAVELLGPPGAFFAWVTIALSLVTIAYVGGSNAAKYPVTLGYDAQPHMAYAHVLLHDHHLPTPAESGEYQQPPGYYVVGGLAARLGHDVFGWGETAGHPEIPEPSYRGAQVLNVILELLTALVILAIARIVAPGRPVVGAAAVAFFAFLPVVAKSGAMFHPETLNMLLSSVAVWLATLMLRAGRVEVRTGVLLAIVLAADLLVRSSAIFTAAAIVAALAIVFGPRLTRRFRLRDVLVAAGIGGAILAGWFLVGRSQDLVHGLLHPSARTAVPLRASFWRFDLGTMFHLPFRPYDAGEAFPVTYTEIWGDWIGVFAWSPYSAAPYPPAVAVLRDQSWIGIVPTLMAIGGWIMLAVRAVRGRAELAAIVLLAPLALAGYLYRSYQFLSVDGDVLRASYVLTSVPAWAIGFGWLFGALGRYRFARLALGACLVVFAVLELRFMVYGLREHRPLF